MFLCKKLLLPFVQYLLILRFFGCLFPFSTCTFLHHCVTFGYVHFREVLIYTFHIKSSLSLICVYNYIGNPHLHWWKLQTPNSYPNEISIALSKAEWVTFKFAPCVCVLRQAAAASAWKLHLETPCSLATVSSFHVEYCRSRDYVTETSSAISYSAVSEVCLWWCLAKHYSRPSDAADGTRRYRETAHHIWHDAGITPPQ